MSPKARRLLVLAGVAWSFGGASRHLEEFCHLKVSDDTIRRVCDEQGTHVGQWLLQDPAPAKAIKRAQGNHEFYTDGVTEALNSRKEEFGDPLLIETLLSSRNLTAAELISRLFR